MLKNVLLTATNTGPFAAKHNNRVKFVIPAGQVINPSKCFIQLMLHLTTPDETLFNMALVNTANSFAFEDTPIFNVDYIKHATMTSARGGTLEYVRNAGFLNRNLMSLSMSTTESLSQINTVYQTLDYESAQLITPFLEISKLGDVRARYRDVPMRIPLSQIFSMGALEMLDTNATGDITIDLELNSNIVNYKPGFFSLFNGTEQYAAVANTGGTVFAITQTFPSIKQSPFYVGQTLQQVSTDNNNNTTRTNVAIINIDYDQDVGEITLTVDTELPMLEADYDSIIFSEVSPDDLALYSITIPYAHIGLAYIQGVAEKPPNSIEYTTFVCEEFSSTGQELNHVFEVEGNAVNCVLMFQQDPSLQVSNCNQLQSYRVSIDNKDVYDRPVNVNIINETNLADKQFGQNPLAYDGLNRWALNSGVPLKNLALVCPAVNESILNNRYINANNRITMVPLVCPITPIYKKVQFNLSASDNITQVLLFKQILKTVNF